MLLITQRSCIENWLCWCHLGATPGCSWSCLCVYTRTLNRICREIPIISELVRGQVPLNSAASHECKTVFSPSVFEAAAKAHQEFDNSSSKMWDLYNSYKVQQFLREKFCPLNPKNSRNFTCQMSTAETQYESTKTEIITLLLAFLSIRIYPSFFFPVFC